MIDFNMPMADYLKHSAYSSSQLKKILISPADFKAALDQPSEETRATTLGTMVHTLILEPHTFDERYILQPADSGPRNVGFGFKMWRDFKIQNADRIPVSWEDAQYLKRVRDAVDHNEKLIDLLNDGRPEVTAIEYHEGLELKARTDLYGGAWMADVKTTGDAIDDATIFKNIFSFGYHFQMAHHMTCLNLATGDNIKNYYWIFVTTQTQAVHIRVVRCPLELMEWGFKDHKRACEMVYECIEENDWPGFSPYIDNLEIPDWARRLYES